MIRVALVIGQLGLGGAEKQVCQLAEALPAHGYRPIVISLGEGGERESALQAKGVRSYTLPRNGSFDASRLFKTTSILREYRPEIVHGFDYTGSVYGRLAGALAGIPILIGGVRSDWVPPKRILLIERLLRRKTKAIISNSLAGKKAWARMSPYPESGIVVVPNGFNFAEMERSPTGFRSLRDLLGIRADEFLVGSIGSIYHLKNPLMYVRVAAMVRDGGNRVHFAWIGDGPMREEIERSIDAHRLRGVVHIIDRRADAPWLARDFNIGVMTSVIEGMPNAIMEYMYWSLPVITTNAGGCAELVEHGSTGFVVEKNDISAMAAYIQQLIRDHSTAREMGRRGRERLEREFSAEAMVAKTVAVYDQVRAGSRSALRQFDPLRN